jgi:uncharacterized protein DUF6518
VTDQRAVAGNAERNAINTVLTIVVVGIGLGVVTQLAQGLLPTGWSQAANSIAPWLLVAFLVGAAQPGWRSAAVAGGATLLLALAGYYAMTLLRFAIGAGPVLLFWIIGAVVGGPVFGAAGWSWKHGRRPALALGLLAAAFIAEAGFHLVVLAEPPVAAGFALAGLLVPLTLGRSRAERIDAYLWAIPMTLLGGLGFGAFIVLYGIITGVGVGV